MKDYERLTHETQQEDITMAGSYEDRDGKIWLDGQLYSPVA